MSQMELVHLSGTSISAVATQGVHLDHLALKATGACNGRFHKTGEIESQFLSLVHAPPSALGSDSTLKCTPNCSGNKAC